MTDTAPASDRVTGRDAAGFTRLLRVLDRQHRRPEVMAGFFAAIGARGVVSALAHLAFGPQREDLAGWEPLPGLLRRGLHAAASWPEFDAEGFGADLADLLRDAAEDERATVSAVTSYLLASGRYDARMLAGWSRAFDELVLPTERALSWGSFITGVDGPQPWDDLVLAARERAVEREDPAGAWR